MMQDLMHWWLWTFTKQLAGLASTSSRGESGAQVLWEDHTHAINSLPRAAPLLTAPVLTDTHAAAECVQNCVSGMIEDGTWP